MGKALLGRFLWIAGIAVAAGLLLFLRSTLEGPRSPLSEGVYVWQRVWTAEVAEALQGLPGDIQGVLPLVAEVAFEPGSRKAKVTRIRWKPGSFSQQGPPLTMVIRVGDSGAKTNWDSWACAEIRSLASELLKEATAGEVEVVGLQIDYDCPASRLGDYGKLLRSLQEDEELASFELSFTSLPSWLDSDKDGFRALAEISDYFVLQVHALELPKTARDPVVVMNPSLARSAVKKAAQLEAPYFVALPTYSSFVVFDKSTEKVVNVISEDLDFSTVSEDQRLILGEAPAEEIAGMISAWSRQAPDPHFQGVFWYRLPVKGDVLNWPASAWAKVRAGEVPQRELRVDIQTEDEAFHRLTLRNVGELPDAHFPKAITVRLEGAGSLVGADGGRWYATEGAAGDEVSFTLVSQKHDFVPLPIGRELPIGWVRKTGQGELVVEFSR